MRKKLLAAFAITVAATLSAAGCGGSASGSGGNSIKVVYWQHLDQNDNKQQKFLASMKTSFEKAHPGKKIEVVPVTASENDYYTKIQLMMRSPSTAPDLVYEDTALINSDIASGYLKPIDSYVKSWADWGSFAKAAKGAVSSPTDGKTYGVPDDTDTRGIWYNQNLLKKAGIATPWQPKTWQDILDTARTIKKKLPGVTPMNFYTGQAGGEQSTMQGFEMLLYGTDAADNSLYDAKNKKWIVGSQGFKDALTFVHTVYSENLGLSKPTALGPNAGAEVGTKLLPDNKLAIDIDGSWMANNWLKTGPRPWPDWAKTMASAAMPTQAGQAPGRVSMSGGWAWSIPAKAKNPDLAWQFTKAIKNKDNSTKWNIIESTTAVRTDVAADPKYLDATPTNKFFTGLVAYTHFRPALPKYPQVSNAITKAMESVTTGQSSVDQAAKTYDQDLATAVGSDSTAKGAR
ncbi:extracellular solute-binding protein [Streptomyces fuscigenes]|uniref:extracellular solute-binding protein n=1 Tax=Streptomyces fuscigenes TaxID=1528880 RepID=UPI001F2FDDD2|nr:extracellular solute-binding protein [Streptomyces fuscigenes]MCF3962901.1 extracellular solute-binding protein [Streptomyces fuscigenes]